MTYVLVNIYNSCTNCKTPSLSVVFILFLIAVNLIKPFNLYGVIGVAWTFFLELVNCKTGALFDTLYVFGERHCRLNFIWPIF